VVETSEHVSRRAAQNALESLPAVERFFCGALIQRQLDRSPRIETEIAKYGPDGAVKISSARTIGLYMSVVVFIAVGLAAAGANRAGLVALILAFFLSILVVSRVVSAGMAGRRWRAGQ
jgi:hypothetical protein